MLLLIQRKPDNLQLHKNVMTAHMTISLDQTDNRCANKLIQNHEMRAVQTIWLPLGYVQALRKRIEVIKQILGDIRNCIA